MSWFVDDFSKDIWETKYKGDTPDIETFFENMARRFSRGNRDLERRFYNLFYGKRMSPGGRILAAGGRPAARLSLMNCTTHTITDDSLEAISDAVYTIMRASSRGQGIGLDLSHLRPMGSPVDNAAKTSTGAISFMEMLNAVSSTIGQEGRRAAVLYSLDVSHPDVYRPGEKDHLCPRCNGSGCDYCDHSGYLPYDFLHVKKLPGRVEGANISVRLTDAFMTAVSDDAMWEMRYDGVSGGQPFVVSRTVPARQLFDALAKAARESAEPGVLFLDTARDMSNSDLFGDRWKVVSTNACVSPDTLVTTRDGDIPIEVLATMQTLPEVLTVNEQTGAWEWEVPNWVTMTRENATVITLDLDNGETLTLTPDHKVLTDNREWVVAGSLTTKDTLVGRHSPVRVKQISTAANTDTYDLSNAKNHNFFANGVLVHNCSEEWLDQDGVCNLGSMNLSAYVIDPFTRHARFDFSAFAQDVETAVEFLDNVVTVELESGNYISETQRMSLEYLRRTGLGTMGLADTLAMRGLAYDGSPNTMVFVQSVYETFRDAAYLATIDLARRFGPAKVWDNVSEAERRDLVERGFFRTLPEYLKRKIVDYGTRNITVLSIAPTGSISNLYGVSSGIEPVFALSYRRRTRMHGQDEFVEYVHPAVRLSRANGLPDSVWQTAYSVSPDVHVSMQATVQTYNDASISKTLNFPASATAEDVGKMYMMGWLFGLKGMSVYVDGSREIQVLYANETVTEAQNLCPSCSGEIIFEDGCSHCSQCDYAVCSV